jgi:hypothetical protein
MNALQSGVVAEPAINEDFASEVTIAPPGDEYYTPNRPLTALWGESVGSIALASARRYPRYAAPLTRPLSFPVYIIDWTFKETTIRIHKRVRWRNCLIACGLPLLLFLVARTQTEPPAFRLRTQIPPRLATGQRYRIHLDAAGGRLPLDWRVSKGKLPPGLQLNTQSGEIVGSPTTVGEFAFTLEATDKSQPPQVAQQDFVVQVIAPLTIVWKDDPRVQGNAINGRVAVSNYTGDTFDLTVIIVAVNEIGRATALGYQKLDLASGVIDFEIPFGSTLPVGKYVVHADAIAEVPSKNAIYRARQQTPRPLSVSQQ